MCLPVVDLGVALEALVNESGVVVEYFCVAGTPSDADAKTGALHYPHTRSLVLESWNLEDGIANTSLARSAYSVQI